MGSKNISIQIESTRIRGGEYRIPFQEKLKQWSIIGLVGFVILLIILSKIRC
jgi:hypothetical protein